jgi:hypothetical protein
MIKLEFTEAEQQSLHYERYHHPHPRVQRKMEAAWLKSQGVAHGEISRLTGIIPAYAGIATCGRTRKAGSRRSKRFVFTAPRVT